MADGDIWIQTYGEDFRIGYNFRDTGRFMVLTKEQMVQLKREVGLLDLEYKVSKSSVLFHQVASVIGEEEAEKQLMLAATTWTETDKEWIDRGETLLDAFTWGKTPQGEDYWVNIYDRWQQGDILIYGQRGTIMFDIERAIVFATRAHQGQVRKYTGEPYIFHPLDVARMAIQFKLPEWAIAAAILHDVIEDCGITYNQLRDEFGSTIATAVSGLSHVSKPEDGNRATRRALDRDWFALQHPHIQTVKVLDLISNSQSIKKYDPTFWQVYKQEKAELLDALVLADKEAVAIARSCL